MHAYVGGEARERGNNARAKKHGPVFPVSKAIPCDVHHLGCARLTRKGIEVHDERRLAVEAQLLIDPTGAAQRQRRWTDNG